MISMSLPTGLRPMNSCVFASLALSISAGCHVGGLDTWAVLLVAREAMKGKGA